VVGEAMRALRTLQLGWTPLVLVVALALSGFAIYRMYGIFGSHQSLGASGGADKIVQVISKRVLYEVYGPSGTVGSVSYLDENAKPQRADFTSLPWSFQVTTALLSMFANLVAQEDSGPIGCRITVNGEMREQKLATRTEAQAFCLPKSA
jgi:Mycobacterium membrane protein